ncbi:MAG: response regulator [Betaproteobacteria bacterium]|nr:response regulator [Betaproteobacteria bacterium]
MTLQQTGQQATNLSPPVVAIIDDEFTSRVILDKIVHSIQADIVTHTFPSPTQALEWVQWNQPDLILVDYRMKEMTGLEVITAIRKIATLETIPIVVITSHDELGIRYGALDAGATDFMTKPIDPYECRVRCRNLLMLRQHEKDLKAHSQHLEHAVYKATQQIREREQETLYCLAKAGEFRDAETGNHILRMARYSRLIAEGVGLPQARCELIEMAAPMHDIGKIGIPDHILLKPGRLTTEEYEIMKTHPMIGYKILQESPSNILNQGAQIALGHHEKYDGSGYPLGLKGNAIPLEARIVAVADVFDALTSIRPYKKAWINEDALGYLKDNSGKHFDPACVDAFLTQFSKITLVQEQLRDVPPVPSIQEVQ